MRLWFELVTESDRCVRRTVDEEEADALLSGRLTRCGCEAEGREREEESVNVN